MADVTPAVGAGAPPPLALYDAVKRGDVEECRRLLDAGADPLHCDAKRGNILYECVQQRDPEVLRALLDTPAHELVNEPCFNTTALQLALAVAAPLEIVQLLLDAGAAPRDDEHLTSAHQAAAHPDVRVLVLMLERLDVDVNMVTSGGLTMLQLAASAAAADCVRLLVARGARADAEPRDTFHYTPIMHACDERCGADEDTLVEIVRVLATAGCDVRARDDSGRTALHLAAQRRRARLASELLRMGLSADEEDDSGDTPSSIAADVGISLAL